MTSSISTYRTKTGASFNIPVQLDLREVNGDKVSAHLLQVNTGFFQLSSPVFLQINTLIDLIFERQRLEVEVVFCKADSTGGYAVGARLLASLSGEARREPRIPIEINARFATAALAGSIPAKIIDISRSGLGIKLSRSIPVGSGAILETQTGIAFGEVRHCSVTGKEDWRIGLSLDEFISYSDRSSKTSEESGKRSKAIVALLRSMFRSA